MLRGIQRLWKRWTVPYQVPAAVDETIFPPSDMVMRLRCLIIIVSSWKRGTTYRCWLCTAVAHVHEGFLRWLVGWSSQCCLGERSYWGRIFLVHFHQFALGSWANCAGEVPWLSFSENARPGRAAGQQCCAHFAQPASSRLHEQGSTRIPSFTLVVSLPQWKESFLSYWAVMNHKLFY